MKLAFMDSRRNFIGKFASGMAGAIASPRAVLGANERIRFGLIGAGDRGLQLAREAASIPNAAFAAAADVFGKRLEAARALDPDLKTHSDFRALLDDKSIDAVLIATPQHLHAGQFTAALEAGKHIYQERTLAFTVPEAKSMREAVRRAGQRTIQVGHQQCSSGQMTDAIHFLANGQLGRITAIQARAFRNTPHGKPQWSRPVPGEATAANIDWAGFLGPADPLPFDANRLVNWRLYQDYSGGSVHENLSQQLAFWYRALSLRIPRAVTMTGGVYLWKDGREVPDTMHVSLEHAEEILFSWDSGFGNSQPGTGEDVLGDTGAISRSQQIRYVPQKVNLAEGVELLGRTPTPQAAHMRNFFDAMRSGEETNCPFELGFRVSIACRMAVESYRQGRTVRWDETREEIV